MTDTPATGVRCPSCGEACGDVDAFCEACGAQLTAGVPEPTEPAVAPVVAAACQACGGSVDGSGFCTTCGLRQPSARDHHELDLGAIGGAVTDKGRSHHRNEDAFALGELADGTVVAIVCDGVSTAARSDEASLAATTAALEAATEVLEQGGDPERALQRAAAAAQSAVVVMATPTDVPSCTFVAAIVRGTTVVTGNVGDSRAYLVTPGTAAALTTDDSWAAEVVAAGGMTAEAAYADRRAHHITRWIGPDSPSFVPTITRSVAPDGASVIVCSDGLWNEVPNGDEIARLAAGTAGSGPVAVARLLTATANDRGGRDNITVVVVPTPTRGSDS